MFYSKFARDPAGYLLALLLFSLPFERIPSFGFVGVTIRLPVIIGILLIIVVLTRHTRQVWALARSQIWLAWFLLFAFLSSLASLHPIRSLVVVGFDLFVMLLALVVAVSIRTRSLGGYRQILVAGAVVVSVIGIYQFIGDLAGLPVWLTGLRPDYTKSVFGFPRIQGASLEPLYFANFLLLPLAIEGAYALIGKGRLMVSVLLYACLFLTVSRGGIIAALVLTLILFLVGLKKKRQKASTMLVATCLAGFVFAYVAISVLTPWIGRLNSSSESAEQIQKTQNSHQNFQSQITNVDASLPVSDRGVTRSLAAKAFSQHPVLGIGPGNFGNFAHDQLPEYAPSQTVNNIMLEVLAETGLLGFGALLMFGLSLVRKAILVTKQKQNQHSYVWCLGLLLYLIATLIQYQSFSPLYIIHIWVSTGLLIGLTSATPERQNLG